MKEIMPKEMQETRRSYIDRRADEMALTGAFAGCHAIEVALRTEGYIEAYEALDRPYRRASISRLCAKSQEMKGTARAP
jgi:hypothetical protein